jgi:glycerol kinase
VYSSTDEIRKNHEIEKTFIPEKDNAWREENLKRWRDAISRSLGWQK